MYTEGEVNRIIIPKKKEETTGMLHAGNNMWRRNGCFDILSDFPMFL